MDKYRVSCEVTISMHTVVKADSEKAAIEEAESRGLVQLCHQCATGEKNEEWVTGGELDGSPMNMTAQRVKR